MGKKEDKQFPLTNKKNCAVYLNRIISSCERCMDKWTYFLVGNRYNKSGYIQDEIDGHRALGEPHLVHADRNGNNKIYVLTWSDIFDEFSLRHDYLMCKFELEKEIWLKKHDSIENVVEDIKENSATLDSALIPKRAQN